MDIKWISADLQGSPKHSVVPDTIGACIRTPPITVILMLSAASLAPASVLIPYMIPQEFCYTKDLSVMDEPDSPLLLGIQASLIPETDLQTANFLQYHRTCHPFLQVLLHWMILRRMNETSSSSLLIRFRILQLILSGTHSLTVIGKITLISKGGGINPACYPHSHMPLSHHWPYWDLWAAY